MQLKLEMATGQQQMGFVGDWFVSWLVSEIKGSFYLSVSLCVTSIDITWNYLRSLVTRDVVLWLVAAVCDVSSLHAGFTITIGTFRVLIITWNWYKALCYRVRWNAWNVCDGGKLSFFVTIQTDSRLALDGTGLTGFVVSPYIASHSLIT